MRGFAASAIEIVVLGLGVMLLLVWSNYVNSALRRLIVKAQPRNSGMPERPATGNSPRS